MISLQIVKMLLSHELTEVGQETSDGETALSIATSAGHCKIVNLLSRKRNSSGFSNNK
jgi:ankyrin repeat protein